MTRHRTPTAGRVLLIASLLAVSACHSGFDPSLVTVQLQAATTTAAAPSARYSIIVSNSSGKAVDVLYSTCPGFDILSESGTVVGPSAPAVCTAAAIGPYRLEPGRSVVIPRFWTPTARLQGERLPPGRYVLRSDVYIDREGHRVTSPVEVLP